MLSVPRGHLPSRFPFSPPPPLFPSPLPTSLVSLSSLPLTVLSAGEANRRKGRPRLGPQTWFMILLQFTEGQWKTVSCSLYFKSTCKHSRSPDPSTHSFLLLSSSQRQFLPSREDVLFEPGLRIRWTAPGDTGTSVWWVTPETPAQRGGISLLALALPSPGFGCFPHAQHHEERSRYMLCVCPSVYPDLRPFICPTVHSHTDCPGSALTPCSLLGPPLTSWGSPLLQRGETPGQNQVASQVGLHHRADLWKKWPHTAL